MLNSRELQEVITNIENPKCIQQVGIDLELIRVCRVEGVGSVLKDRTILPQTITIPIKREETSSREGWLLHPGYYEITFSQGCKIPNNVVLKIRQRSSMLRGGGEIHSSIFDPGFETDNVGTFMIIHRTLFIEQGARVAQMYGNHCTPVEEDLLYNGQFQQDRQRTNL
jgi:deoxycytidine triphosphate deaminase